MAFLNKTPSLIHHILTASSRSSRTSFISSRRTQCSLLQSLIPPDRSTRSSPDLDPQSSSSSTSHHRSSSTSTAPSSSSTPIRLPQTESLISKLRAMDITRDRIRLDALFPPPPLPLEVAAEEGLTPAACNDTRKPQAVMISAAQIEDMRSRLSEIPNDWVTYGEFLDICASSEDGECGQSRGKMMASVLEDSGTVMVVGNNVCLHPEQVVRAIQGLIPLPLSPNDPRRAQLAEMEKEKAHIDEKAKALVKRELWGGLAYLVLQTAAFMRLTFWELSWDVMEPICFYVTSLYFMAGYGFFLRTSREPSFEGLFQSRFGSRQTRLMRESRFDFGRYNELRRACGMPQVAVGDDRSTRHH